MNNFGGLGAEFCSYDKSKIVVLPVPFDNTRTWIVGDKWKKFDSSKGPSAIITASQNMELYDEELKCTPAEHGICTYSDIDVEGDVDNVMENVYGSVKSHIDKDKFVVMLGGEHSISFGAVKAFSEKYDDLSVLHIDAHADLRDGFEGEKYSHASVMRRIRDIVKNTISVGVRSFSVEEEEYIEKDRVNMYLAKEIRENVGWISKVVEKLSNNVYVTFDLDAFDPSVLSSVGTPEPGGLDWYTVIELLRAVFSKKNVVGCDVVELAPNSNDIASDFTAAKLVYKMIGYRYS